jgi:ParB/RepB/Spo0J family partition protein
MNAPTPKAAITAMEKPSLQRVFLSALVPSKSHAQESRRARFTKEEIKTLADDIARNGLMQQPLVRPIGGGKWEIVAGERRWLASKEAGLEEIYVNVRELTDDQALEMQLSENLQRKDLHELEEAEGYEELMKLKKVNAEEIAALIDQSRSYVYARLKLLALCPEARKAFYAGAIDSSKALLIARIGHHDTQRQALKDISEGVGDYGPKQPMSYREAHRHIVETYMLKLSAAAFDIKSATLLPKAGDCVKCPKRTGNQADLFGDVKSADVCTDPKCFDEKRQAHYQIAVKELEAKGKKVLFGDDAKKAFAEWDSNHAYSRDELSDRYAPMSGHAWVGHRQVTVRDVLGADYQPLLIQHPATGKIFEVATQQALQAAVQKHNRPGAKGPRSSSKPKATKGPDVDEVLTERLAKLIHQKAPKEFSRAMYLELAKGLRKHLSTRDLDAVALAWGWKASAFSGGYSRKFPAEASKLGERDLVLLMFHMIFAIGQYTRGDVLQLFGIKEPEIRAQILEERKAARTGTKPQAMKIPPGEPSFKAAAGLAAIVGTHPITKTEALRRVLAHVSKEGLRDKTNIQLDARLKAALGKSLPRVGSFELESMVNAQLTLLAGAVGKVAKKSKGKKK